jgi:hypothetical protein
MAPRDGSGEPILMKANLGSFFFLALSEEGI